MDCHEPFDQGLRASVPFLPLPVSFFFLFSLQFVQGQNEEIALYTGTIVMQAVSNKEMFVMPYDNRSFVDPACLVKMARYWQSLFVFMFADLNCT